MDWNSRRSTAILENALVEDRATRDATSYACIDPNQRASATILAKQDCILSGIGCIARILDVYAALDGAVTAHYEVTTHPEIFDGVRLHKGQSVAVIRHNARVILSCERVILNFVQRMSGIATFTRKFVDAVSGTKARILDTRKTAPGLRVIDKHAVRCGGGQNHRLDLSDGVLIKGNHIALAGGIIPALERAIRNRRGRQPIEIEVRSLEELQQALESGAEAILLDNVSIETVRKATDVRLGRIVRLLMSHATVVVSGTKIAEEIGTSRSEVWRLIQQLRGLGVDVAGHPATGYQLRAVPDLLLPEMLGPSLKR